eukprot:1153120-Pelagomonas_calceolata.AAC.2
MAEGVATIAHREGISARPKGTVEFKRVGEAFRRDHAPFMQGRLRGRGGEQGVVETPVSPVSANLVNPC